MKEIAVWLPTVRSGTGTDTFTENLSKALTACGIRNEIAWLPSRAEYLPWSVPVQAPPPWASVIHINTWLHRRFYRNGGLPVLATSHGCFHVPALRPYKSWAQRLYHRFWVRPVERYALAHADAVTTVSQYTAKNLRDIFGIESVDVIHNWLQPEMFCSTIRETPSRKFRLLYLGKWSRRKGSDLLPKIMRSLGDDYELHFTGRPPGLQTLPDNMIALGWSSDSGIVRRWIEEADALLFPSRMEGLPMAVLEAQALGLPVIASERTSIPEIVESGRNGILCRGDDAEQYAGAVKALRGDPDRWKSMQLNAFNMAKERFGERKAIEAYRNVYQRLVG